MAVQDTNTTTTDDTTTGTDVDTTDTGTGDLAAELATVRAELETAKKEEKKWREFSRKNEDRAKGNAEAATELESVTSELKSLRDTVNQLHTEKVNLLKETAVKSFAFKDPDKALKFVTGETQEDIFKSVEEIAESFGVPKGAASTNTSSWQGRNGDADTKASGKVRNTEEYLAKFNL